MIPITPSGAPVFPSTQNSPANGDPLDATQLRNDIEVPFLDGIEAARLLTYGGGFSRRVVALSDTSMTIRQLGAIVVTVAGVWTVAANTVSAGIDPKALAGGAFAASTRYYVYASLVAGVVTFSVSTTAPDIGLRYKAGDTQYQYISTFITNAAAALITYSQSGNDYFYRARSPIGGGVDGNLILDSGSAVVVTSVPFGLAVPANFTAVRLLMQATAGAGNAVAQAGVGLPGGESATLFPPNGGTIAAQEFTLEYVGTSAQYIVNAGTTVASMWVIGFTQ